MFALKNTHTNSNQALDSLFLEKRDEGFLVGYEQRRTVSSAHRSLFDTVREAFSCFPGESFFFLNEHELVRRAHIFQKYFIPDFENRFVAYAIKANPLPRIIQILYQAGIHSFDCASIGEICRVQEVADNPRVFYNNPSRNRTSVRDATRQEVTHFTADTESEVQRVIDSSKEGSEVAIRINPLEDCHEGGQIRLGDKYGVDTPNGIDLLRRVQKSVQSKIGVSLHIGSQNVSPQSHIKNIQSLVGSFKKENIRIDSLNVGGGMPVLPDLDQADNAIVLKKYLQTLSEGFREAIDDVLIPGGKVIIEPGRSLVAPAVDLMIAVNDITTGDGIRILRMDDSIFTNFSDAIIHKWKYVFQVVDCYGEQRKGPLVAYRLDGRTCDSGDVLESILLPDSLEETDYLWITNAGAYMSSQGTVFNGFKSHRYVSYNLCEDA